jgi:hypothetical protein
VDTGTGSNTCWSRRAAAAAGMLQVAPKAGVWLAESLGTSWLSPGSSGATGDAAAAGAPCGLTAASTAGGGAAPGMGPCLAPDTTCCCPATAGGCVTAGPATAAPDGTPAAAAAAAGVVATPVRGTLPGRPLPGAGAPRLRPPLNPAAASKAAAFCEGLNGAPAVLLGLPAPGCCPVRLCCCGCVLAVTAAAAAAPLPALGNGGCPCCCLWHGWAAGATLAAVALPPCIVCAPCCCCLRLLGEAADLPSAGTAELLLVGTAGGTALTSSGCVASSFALVTAISFW